MCCSLCVAASPVPLPRGATAAALPGSNAARTLLSSRGTKLSTQTSCTSTGRLVLSLPCCCSIGYSTPITPRCHLGHRVRLPVCLHYLPGGISFGIPYGALTHTTKHIRSDFLPHLFNPSQYLSLTRLCARACTHQRMESHVQ